ncbi:MAG: hypothetical protein ABIS86_01030 [Streptosporangiaceae bacterium]
MGVLFDYFRAPDEAVALSLHRHPAGLVEAVASTGGTTLDLKGVDPVIMLGKLVGLLSGATYEEMLFTGIPTDHIPKPELITAEQDEDILVELSVVVRDTLAAASDQDLTEAAPIWAGTEEFGSATWKRPDDVRPMMDELVELARLAMENGQMLYCAIMP